MIKHHGESLVMRLTFADQPVSVTFKCADVQIAWSNSSAQIWEMNWPISVVPGDYEIEIDMVWADKTSVFTDRLHVLPINPTGLSSGA